MSRLLVLLNPAAGAASTQTQLVRDLARRHGAEVMGPHKRAELATFLNVAVDHGARRIIVAGGDGSVSHAVNALSARLAEIEMGVVPLGTGNDLARSLDLPPYDMQEAFELAATSPATAMDLIHVQDGQSSFVVNAATAGFGAEVTASVTAGDKQLWGAYAYWLTATRQLASRHPFTVDLQVDGDAVQYRCLGLTLANGRYIGGAFPVASEALLDDGQLDLVVVPELSTMELLAAGMNYLAGWTPYNAGIVVRRARRVVVHATPQLPFSLDGDPVSAFDAVFEVAPRQLRMVPGPKAALV